MGKLGLLKTEPVPWTRRCEPGTVLAALYTGAAKEMTILEAGAREIAAMAISELEAIGYGSQLLCLPRERLRQP